MARVARVAAGLAPFQCLLIAQTLPPLPAAPQGDPLPQPEELAPLRPFIPGESAQGRPPFRWRGENIQDRWDSWSIEQGTIESEGLLLLADRITYVSSRGTLEAEGNIRLEIQGLRLRCQRLRMDWASKAGEAWALELELPPNWILKSQQVSFNSFRHWNFQDVDVSPCPQEKPGWNAKLSHLKLDLDEFATFRNARVYLGGVFLPPYYLPWATYPAKAQRSSGLLPPQVGLGSSSMGLSYYQVLGETMDATFAPEYYNREGMLWGGEYRWAPDLTHQGFLQGQFIRQKTDDERRYRFVLRELWQREDGWQFTAEVNQASDSLLEADFGKGIGHLGTPSFDSALYLGKNFPWAAVSFSAAEQKTFFLPDDPFYTADFPSSMRRQSLPQFQARIYPIPLGLFYFDASLRLSRHAYRIQTGDEEESSKYLWSRGDFLTRLQGRLGQWGPFRSDLQLSTRVTGYSSGLESDVFNPNAGSSGSSVGSSMDSFRVDGDPITRKLASARLQFSGPQLGRSFENFHIFGYSGELKHVLEPFFALTATTASSDSWRVPRFDEVDTRPGVGGSVSGERSVEIGLKQHILGRPGTEGAFNDLVRWRLSTRFYFQPIILPDGRYKKGWASLDSDIDVEPNDRLRISFRQSSETSEGGTDNALSADYKTTTGGRFSLALFSTGINRFLVRQQGLQISGNQQLWDERWKLEFQASYDKRLGRFSSAEAALAYVMPCTAISLRYSHVARLIPVSGGKENRVDLVLTLRGLGDLLSWRR